MSGVGDRATKDRRTFVPVPPSCMPPEAVVGCI